MTGDINIDRLKPNHADHILLENKLATLNIRRLPLPPTIITPDTSTSIKTVYGIFQNMTLVQQFYKLDYQIIQLKCAVWTVVKIIPIHKLYGDKWEGETSTSLSLVSIKNWDTVHKAEDAESAFNIFERVLRTALDIACHEAYVPLLCSVLETQYYIS
ncbi:hypothetical protein J6590_073794 [Homalodisca vitripennis]|nr:hypothetical protein J6590_073794 [Homalodisca vitripennis]